MVESNFFLSLIKEIKGITLLISRHFHHFKFRWSSEASSSRRRNERCTFTGRIIRHSLYVEKEHLSHEKVVVVLVKSVKRYNQPFY